MEIKVKLEIKYIHKIRIYSILVYLILKITKNNMMYISLLLGARRTLILVYNNFIE